MNIAHRILMRLTGQREDTIDVAGFQAKCDDRYISFILTPSTPLSLFHAILNPRTVAKRTAAGKSQSLREIYV